jgi:L-fucose isomerase-like protein
MTNIYTLTSTLHDPKSVEAATSEFLQSLNIDYALKGSDFSDYGQADLNLIYVRTGGTEGIFKPLLPSLMEQSRQPVYLLTSGKSNSLAASMEILSYLRQQGIKGEILHGDAAYIRQRIALLQQVESARKRLQGRRLGIIGQPSDWLISSDADNEAVLQRLGITLVDVPMSEVISLYPSQQPTADAELMSKAPTEGIRASLPGTLKIYQALREITLKYRLDGLTIRCFDLLTAVHNTGCIALAKLNSEGIIAGCEGDVPAMLSMTISKAITGVSGFQANPARINPETGELLFAHCTIPFNMVEHYELDTHFESGIGVGIRGYMKGGPVTIFKVSGHVDRHFAEEAQLVRNQGKADLCRTQQVIRLDDASAARYFLTDPIGNHHIIMPGHWKAVIDALLE